MLEKPPSLIPAFCFAVFEIFCLTATQIYPAGWISVLAYYGSWLFGILLAVSAGAFLARTILFSKSMLDLSRPDVRITQAHAEIATQISKMSMAQMSHHINVINALQLPFQLDPNGSIMTLDGIEIKVSSLLKYISGLQPESVGGPEGESVYRMTPERNADPEDREAYRHLADEIEGRSFAVSGPKGNKPVLVTKKGIMQYLDEVLTKNELQNA